MTANFAMATLGANRAGTWVRAVVCAAGRITVYLNVKASAATPVTWLVLGQPPRVPASPRRHPRWPRGGVRGACPMMAAHIE